MVTSVVLQGKRAARQGDASNQMVQDLAKMDLAIAEAMIGHREGGIPIGAVLERDGVIIARGHNRRIQSGDPLSHAEVDCLRNLGQNIGRASGGTLYTTHMPCHLCVGAISQFEIRRVIAGESETFPHARWLLDFLGIEAIDLDIAACKALLQPFIKTHQELWTGMPRANSPNKISNLR